MKNSLKILLQWLSLTIILAFCWLAGMMAGNAIFPSDLMNAGTGSSQERGMLLMFAVTAMNSAVILFFIHRTTIKGWKLTGALALIMFGVQYFMAQIETLWFNDNLHLPVHGIYAILSGGLITSMLFAMAATWITGNFTPPPEGITKTAKISWPSLLKTTALLAIMVWPAVYFIAGYYIAWQFEAVRVFYSGNAGMDSFFMMMGENFASGLYFFQIPRGVLWVMIALLVLTTTRGSRLRKGIMLGLLLSVLSSSGLLLPNPYMSEAVRMAHLLETSTSNFIWGIIMAWFLGRAVQQHHV